VLCLGERHRMMNVVAEHFTDAQKRKNEIIKHETLVITHCAWAQVADAIKHSSKQQL